MTLNFPPRYATLTLNANRAGPERGDVILTRPVLEKKKEKILINSRKSTSVEEHTERLTHKSRRKKKKYLFKLAACVNIRVKISFYLRLIHFLNPTCLCHLFSADFLSL